MGRRIALIEYYFCGEQALAAAGSGAGGPWVKADTSAAGAPTVGGLAGGGLRMLLASNTEVENLCVYHGDVLSFDIDVSGCGRPLKAVAADLDMTSSELSRKLSNNPNDPVHFPLDCLPELITATGDLRPIYWLIEAFLDDADAKRKRDLEELSALIPRLQRLVHSVGTEAGTNGRS